MEHYNMTDNKPIHPMDGRPGRPSKFTETGRELAQNPKALFHVEMKAFVSASQEVTAVEVPPLFSLDLSYKPLDPEFKFGRPDAELLLANLAEMLARIYNY